MVAVVMPPLADSPTTLEASREVRGFYGNVMGTDGDGHARPGRDGPEDVGCMTRQNGT